MTGNGYGYIDADGHVRDNPDVYKRYMKAPYNARVQPGGPRDGYDGTMGRTLGTEFVDANKWLEEMDKNGLEATFLYPTTGLALGYIMEQDYAVARSEAYNNFLHEEYLSKTPRFQGVALLPVQDPAAAAQELRRAVTELGMAGAMLPADGQVRGFGKRDFDPIYEEAQRLGVMIGIHGQGRLWGGVDEFFFDRFIQVHTLGHPWAQMKHLVSMIFEGVFERFPNLRVAYLEAGCTWVPFLMDRMDEKFRLRGEQEASLLTKYPSEYVKSGNIYFSLEGDERLIPETLREVGDDVVLYATDFPHWDNTFPDNLHELLEREDITDTQKEKILHDNPKRLYAVHPA